MGRSPVSDHRLRLDDGRMIGYATWGGPEGAPVLVGHGTPGSRRDRYPLLDDPDWLREQRIHFVGVDRPGYGYSDPRPDASILDCAEDFVRVADHLGFERFAALGISGGGPYVLALGASHPERVERVAVVSGIGMIDRPGALDGMSESNVSEFKMALESPNDLASALGDAARALREDPDGTILALLSELPEVDRRTLERPDVRALLVESLGEAVRQGATGWVDDDLRFIKPWPFHLDQIDVEVLLFHGTEDVLVPRHHPEQLAEGLQRSRLQLYPDEGHISISKHIGEVVKELLAT